MTENKAHWALPEDVSEQLEDRQRVPWPPSPSTLAPLVIAFHPKALSPVYTLMTPPQTSPLV